MQVASFGFLKALQPEKVIRGFSASRGSSLQHLFQAVLLRRQSLGTGSVGAGGRSLSPWPLFLVQEGQEAAWAQPRP